MKCCNTCKYGVISEFLEKRGEELVDGWRAKIETFEEAVEKWNRRAENDRPEI